MCEILNKCTHYYYIITAHISLNHMLKFFRVTHFFVPTRRIRCFVNLLLYFILHSGFGFSKFVQGTE